MPIRFSVALAQFAGLLDHLFDELVGDLVYHVDTFGRGAHLTGVREGAPDRTVRCALDVGVGAHDHRVFAA